MAEPPSRTSSAANPSAAPGGALVASAIRSTSSHERSAIAHLSPRASALFATLQITPSVFCIASSFYAERDFIMSAINSLASALGTTGSSSSSSSTTNASTNLTPSDFIQFMVTELQNQDPLDPTDPSQMLSQMSQIGQLQSADTLQSSLTSMVQQNQVAAAGSMIGKLVQGTDANANQQTGIVSAVQVSSTGVNLTLSTGATVPMNNVTAITDAPTSTTTTPAPVPS
jgi:flagellar basal-body rod modification protein FlgD